MKYIVAGPTIINDIFHKDGTKSKKHLGGAIFCLAGIKLWSDDCLYVSNVGRDFDTYYGKWMEDNMCSREGLNIILPHTQYTLLEYGEHGLHSEASIYGATEEELVNDLDKPDADVIAKHCGKDTKGIYIEASETDEFWNHLDQIHEKGDITIMWEIPTSAAMQPERRGKVLEVIRKAGLYSVNLPEAMSLFKARDEKEAIYKMLEFGVPCYFRVGQIGSYMLSGQDAWFAESITLGEVIDTTGCGNCSTAAALYAFCEKMRPAEIAAVGNISAAYNLLQYGPYPKVTKQIRLDAKTKLKQMTTK